MNYWPKKFSLFLYLIFISFTAIAADSDPCHLSILSELTSNQSLGDVTSSARIPQESLDHVVRGDFTNGRLQGGMHTFSSVDDFQAARVAEIQELLDLPTTPEGMNQMRKFLRQYTNTPYYQGRINLDEPVESLQLMLRRFQNFETQTFPNGVTEVRIPAELISNNYRKKLRIAAKNEPYLFDSESQSYVKTLFPRTWDGEQIQRAAQYVFSRPTREFSISESSIVREGVFEGVNVRIISSPDGEIRTIYPVRPSDQQNLH